MADDATITMKAVILPDDIQATLKDLTASYTPAGDGTEKWFYKLVTVVHTSNATDLISGNYIESGYEEIATGDKVRFLFIKNTGTTNGTATTEESILISLSGATVAYNSEDTIEIGAGESWYGKLPNVTVGNIHARAANAGAVSDGDASVQCIVAAILDDVSE
tara:strand:+ start:10594 stop:11082 length:489 start_codon:yes stop_codon:yes gene_type:complete